MKKTGFDIVKEKARLFEGHVSGYGVLKDGTRTITVVRSRPYEHRKMGSWIDGEHKVEIEGYSEPPGQGAALCDYLEEECGLDYARPALIWSTADYLKFVRKQRLYAHYALGQKEREDGYNYQVNEYLDQEVWRVTLYLKPETAAEVAPHEVMVEIARHIQNETWRDGVSVSRIVNSQVYRPGDRVLLLDKGPLIKASKYYFVCAYRSRVGQAMYRLIRVNEAGKVRLTCAANIRLFVGE